jgi:hypothetical protein
LIGQHPLVAPVNFQPVALVLQNRNNALRTPLAEPDGDRDEGLEQRGGLGFRVGRQSLGIDEQAFAAGLGLFRHVE